MFTLRSFKCDIIFETMQLNNDHNFYAPKKPPKYFRTKEKKNADLVITKLKDGVQQCAKISDREYATGGSTDKKRLLVGC